MTMAHHGPWTELLITLYLLPSGYVEIAIENGHRNSGVFPLKMVIFHSYLSHSQRVYQPSP